MGLIQNCSGACTCISVQDILSYLEFKLICLGSPNCVEFSLRSQRTTWLSMPVGFVFQCQAHMSSFHLTMARIIIES
jgi:hypothetical protein